MNKPQTIDDLCAVAQVCIDNEDTICFDVADECGQMVDNVKHMQWFLLRVMEQLCDDYPAKYGPLLSKVNARQNRLGPQLRKGAGR